MKYRNREIKPIHIDTRREAQDLSDVSFVHYYDEVVELFDRIDKYHYDNDLNTLHHIADQLGIKQEYRNDREIFLQSVKDTDNKYFELYIDLKEKTPELRESFKKDIIDFLSHIEGDYDIERVCEIIDNLAIRFASIDIGDFENTDYTAYYASHYVNFNLFDFLSNHKVFKQVFYHEFLHALSTNHDRIFFEKQENSAYNKIQGPQSTGLQFRGSGDKKRFTWINEAVTERLAFILSEGLEDLAYKKEIRFLDLLNKKKKVDSVLNFNLLIKTYFRHLEKREVDDWKEFSREVDKAFGPRFLVLLDIYIQKNGLDKAMEIVSSWPDGEPRIEDIAIQGESNIPKDFYNVDDSEL